MKVVLQIFILVVSVQLFGQQLTYKPVNPNFGGDTFNYQFLLSQAESQNKFEDPNATDLNAARGSSLDNFTENLNNQILNNVSRTLFSDAFGDGDLAPGNYSFGSLEIEIFPSNDGLVINILDTTTGEQTQLVIPQ